jgi:NADPH-dependent ferric siderophore reductase
MIYDTTASRVLRVRHELKRRDLQVVRVETISPHFKSITFAGAALDDFISLSFDDHLKFMLDGAEPVRRDYTPRRYNAEAQELTIEFATHSEGRAAQWAEQATPGQQATIGGPRSSFVIPTNYAWHLLVGDETALPAIHRRLEELPVGTRVLVVVQLADAADRRELRSSADVSVMWVPTTEALLESIRTLDLPLGEGYTWCAGEATVMTRLRRILVEEKELNQNAIRVSAYWKRGKKAHHENLEE